MPKQSKAALLQDSIDSAIETLEAVYQPETTREDLAQAVGEALDSLRGEDAQDDDDEEGEGDEDDE